MPEYHWISEEIFTVSGFLRPEECETFIGLAESIGFADAPVNTMFGPQLRQDVMIDDTARAVQLWERVRDYIPQSLGRWRAVGVNERLRFYRYEVGQIRHKGQPVAQGRKYVLRTDVMYRLH